MLEERTGRTFGAGPRPLLLSVRSSGDDVDARHARDRPERRRRRRGRRGARRGVFGGVRRRHPGALPTRLSARGGGRARPANRWRSCAAPSRRSRRPGRPAGSTPTARTADSNAAASQSCCRPWSSAISTPNRAPGCCSPATRRPGRRRRSANGSPPPRATTWCPAPATASPCRRCGTGCPTPTTSWSTAGARLERLGADVQDVEFTVEAGKLWLLQSRVAQRSPRAALRLALTFRDEGRHRRRRGARSGDTRAARDDSGGAIGPESGRRWPPAPPPAPESRPAWSARPATTPSPRPTRATTSSWCARRPAPTTSPASWRPTGVVTEVGGASSHAAIVARELGIPAVVGCGVGLTASLAGLIDHRRRRRRRGAGGRIALRRSRCSAPNCRGSPTSCARRSPTSSAICRPMHRAARSARR